MLQHVVDGLALFRFLHDVSWADVPQLDGGEYGADGVEFGVRLGSIGLPQACWMQDV